MSEYQRVFCKAIALLTLVNCLTSKVTRISQSTSCQRQLGLGGSPKLFVVICQPAFTVI